MVGCGLLWGEWKCGWGPGSGLQVLWRAVCAWMAVVKHWAGENCSL
jgi:hypothetical protein